METLDNGISTSDEASLRLAPKLDRRQHRTGTPDCPRCCWDDSVSVVGRERRALTWRCSRCAWAWIQSVPAR